MRTQKTRVRLWVVGPFLFYLLVFLLWFPRWQHAPHSLFTRLLGVLFAAMTAVLVMLYLVGEFFGPWGWGVGDDAVRIYQHFKGDAETVDVGDASREASLNHPALVITKRLQDGTPVRGACPVCEVEFSTEAFYQDKSYPHESKLEQQYDEHFRDHMSEGHGDGW
jgi:hypothetical protein